MSDTIREIAAHLRDASAIIKEMHSDVADLTHRLDTATEALHNIVAAWEALPGGTYYNSKRIEGWLRDHMKPEIDNIRVLLRIKGYGDE